MRNLFLLLILGLCYSLNVSGQYFNTPLFNARFDTAEDLQKWTEETAPLKEGNSYWSLGEASRSFSLIDPNSTNSLKFEIKENGKFISILTSPEIDAKAQKGLAVGFYHLVNVNMPANQKIFYFIEVSADNGAIRDTLFNSKTDIFKGTVTNGWRYSFMYLSQKYDNKKIKFRLIVDAQEFTGSKASLCLDGFYLTNRFQNDANLYYSNMQRNNRLLKSNDKVFSNTEPVVVRIKNNGTDEITSINLVYQIDENAPVKEIFKPKEAIQTGDSAEYVFNAKADLGKFKTIYAFKTWADLLGDTNHLNDTITELLNNIVTDIPYIPKFWYNFNGQIRTDDDQWLTDANYNSGWWRTVGGINYWNIDFSRAAEDCNAVLRSRPMYFKAGVEYEIRFNAYTRADGSDELESNQKNKLSISITKDPKGLENLTELWKNEALDRKNGLNSSIRFKVKEDAAYFISFKCTSLKTAKELRVGDFYFVTAPKVDPKPVTIISPSDDKFMFENKEAIKVAILNNGLEAIAANTLKVCAKLNDESVIEETVKEAIPVNGILNYTFNKTIDLSDLAKKHTVQVWTNLNGDENLLNDTISKVVFSKVAGIPYTADFSLNDDSSYPSEKNMWEIVDNNNDGVTFVAEKLDFSKSFLFSYGGTTSTEPIVTVPTSDESLYTRPIMLQVGSNYRIQYSANIISGSGDDRSLNLKTVLYKLVDGNKTEVQILCNESITSYNSKEHIINIKEDGVYVIGYHVQKDKPIDYTIRINNLKVTETADTDIALDEILYGAKNISAYKTLPIGVRVSNPGINAIKEFTVTISAPFMETQSQTFQKSIEPLKNAFVYFDKEITFTGTEDATLTVTVSTENDGFESNNIKTLNIGYLEDAQLPYSVEFRAEEGFLAIDYNKDNRLFKAYQQTATSGLTTQIYGYSISDNLAEGNDILMTRSFNFNIDKVYKVTFGYTINNSGVLAPSSDVYALNVGSGERTPVTMLISDGKYGIEHKFVGYFSVKESGVYTLCFDPTAGDSQNFRDKLTIEEVTEKPDVCISEILRPTQDGVFGKTEMLEVLVKNNGLQPLQGISFTCQVADTTHYVCMDRLLEPDKVIGVEFSNVNLYQPGDYTLTIKTDAQVDKTPEDNTFTKVIKSLPIVEMEMRSVDSPKSGNLTNGEAIKVSVVNNGKGAIAEVPVHYSITHVETNQTVTADEIIKAKIGETEIFQFTFDKKADLSKEGTYNIMAYVDAANETVLTNDTIRISIVSANKIFDVGVSAITNPTDGLHTTTEQVTVKVTNFGEVDLYDIPVFAVVKKDGNTVKELSAVVKQCLVGKTAEYTFTEVVDMYLHGEYEIKAYTKAETDRNAANDTCVVVIKSLKADCGVVEIVNPKNEFEVGMQLITIVVKNFGEVALTDIPVKFKVGTMPQNGKIEGVLAPGESITYTFPREYNFRTEQEYTLTVYTDLEIDMDKENDALEKVIKALPVGIQSESDVELSIYPNPVKDILNVKANNEMLKSVVLYDRSGKMLFTNKDINERTFTMSVAQFAEGMYLLEIETERGRTVYKVLKEN